MKVSALNEGIPKSAKMVHFTSAEENKKINSEVNPSSNSLAKAIPVAVFLTLMPANGTPQQMESVLNQLNAKNTTELYSPQPEKDIDSVRFDDTLQQPKPKIGIFNAEHVLDHKRFKVGDEYYTIYYNSMLKAYRNLTPPRLTNIFVVEDGFIPRLWFDGNDMSPPQVIKLIFHDTDDPNKNYLSVITEEIEDDFENNRTIKITKEVKLPDDIANELMYTIGGDGKYPICTLLKNRIKIIAVKQ